MGWINSIINLKFSPNRELARALRLVTGFTPTHLELYQIAITHSSSNKDVGFNNERLELLGDSVFNLVITDFLYHKYPYRDEGYLTEMRAKMVSRTMMNQLAIKMGLSALVQSTLSQKTLQNSSTPGNTLEALVGAIYLDKGLEKARQFIEQKIIHVLLDMDELENQVTNFKSLVINYAQRERLKVEFRLEVEREENNRKFFEVAFYLNGKEYGRAYGPNKKRAEQEAARQACEKLNLLD